VKALVKLGGTLLDALESRAGLAAQIVEQSRRGHQIAVVHGGGSALTRTLQLLGKKSEFVNGLRVTDAETRDVALMVLAGIVNKNLVAAITAAGQPAVGLCGGDGGVFRARKKQDSEHDLGFVGEICFAEPRWIKAIWAEGGVPVLSSVALGSDGEYYNVNADQMAAACAIACQADALIFLTDVPGVKQADGSVMARLNTAEVAGLIATAVIRGGMMPKLEACTQALKRGVGRVRILPAAQVDVLPLFYFERIDCGTEVLRA
jgi:acetylglutamate kinase